MGSNASNTSKSLRWDGMQIQQVLRADAQIKQIWTNNVQAQEDVAMKKKDEKTNQQKRGWIPESNVMDIGNRWDGSKIDVQKDTRISTSPIVVPYFFKSNLPTNIINLIRQAINIIEEEAPGISFMKLKVSECENKNYIEFVSKDIICYSLVGMKGGRQEINLAPDANIGNCLHELMHSLGFMHEHQREDRDNYVECRTQDKDINYQKMGISLGRYDADSIMHYPLFSEGIMEKDNKQLWAPYQRDHLSNGDKIALNIVYPPPPLQSENETRKRGRTGLYYCGKPKMENNNSPFGRIYCDGYCGPNNGPNCPSCRQLNTEEEKRKVNRDGVLAVQGETGLFYCGRYFGQQKSDNSVHDGYCGPNNGPCCPACFHILNV